MQPPAKEPSGNVPPIVVALALAGTGFFLWPRVSPYLSDDPQVVREALNERSAPQAVEAAPAPVPAAEEDWPYTVARIDAGGDVDRSGSEVRRVETAFLALEGKFVESRRQMADMCVKGREILAESGIQESTVSIMEHVAASVPADMPKGTLKLAEVSAAYLTLRQKGFSD